MARTSRTAALLAPALLCTGCGGGGGGAPGSSSGAGAPPSMATTGPATAEPSAGSVVGVTDIRLGRQDGFDRVVLEVADAG